MNNEAKLGSKIAYYRRLNEMTQEDIAKLLNVSTQAVSKWEQQITSPDIMLLPLIAEVFNISIDELFGKQIYTEPIFDLIDSVPWKDDHKIRFAIYHGKKLMYQSEYELSDGSNAINFHFDYGKNYKINGICKLNKG